MHNYEGSFGVFPPGFINDHSLAENRLGATYTHHGVMSNRAQWSWVAMILPFIEQKPAFDQLAVSNRRAADAFADATVLPIFQTQIGLLSCPSDNSPPLNEAPANDGGPRRPQDSAATTRSVANMNYVGNTDPGTGGGELRLSQNNTGLFANDSSVRMRDITDGTSNVLMFGERAWRYRTGGCSNLMKSHAAIILVTRGSDVVLHRNRGGSDAMAVVGQGLNPMRACDHATGDNGWETRSMYSSLHPGGVQFVLCDGVVRFISDNVDLTVLRRAANRLDGNTVSF